MSSCTCYSTPHWNSFSILTLFVFQSTPALCLTLSSTPFANLLGLFCTLRSALSFSVPRLLSTQACAHHHCAFALCSSRLSASSVLLSPLCGHRLNICVVLPSLPHPAWRHIACAILILKGFRSPPHSFCCAPLSTLYSSASSWPTTLHFPLHLDFCSLLCPISFGLRFNIYGDVPSSLPSTGQPVVCFPSFSAPLYFRFHSAARCS